MHRIAILFVCALAVFAFGCDKPDDVTQIRTMIDATIDAGQRHDINEMMEHVTADFTVNPGSKDEQSVRGILLIALRQFGDFTVKYPVPGIVVAPDGQTADANVPFLVVSKSAEFPDVTDVRDDPVKWLEAVGDKLGEPYRLKLELTKASGEWKVRKATLQSSRTLGSGGRF